MTDYKVIKFMRNGAEYCLPKPGGDTYCLDYLVVAGGGGGGGHCETRGGGGGGGGGVQCGTAEKFTDTVMNVCVGKGGTGGSCTNSWDSNYSRLSNMACKGGDSSLGEIYSSGGGYGGGGYYFTCGGDGGSGGGAAASVCGYYGYVAGFNDGLGKGNKGGDNVPVLWPGGGGGAGLRGGSTFWTCPGCGDYCYNSQGGSPMSSDISGTLRYYSAGGGAGPGGGGLGGGAGSCGGYGTNATCCGAGGGGGYYGGGNGANGIVIIRYPKDGSYGITNAIGGCKYECGDYCIHCFTQDGYFAINPSGCYISYLVVGGGGGIGACGAPGGGGAVCFGTEKITTNSISIVIGSGGRSCGNGCDSCIGENIIAKGGKSGCCENGWIYSGDSGSGCKGGRNSASCCAKAPGGGGASGDGETGDNSGNRNQHLKGGSGYFGFGGGGSGVRGYYFGGRDGGTGSPWLDCGGGGGFTGSYSFYGQPGVVDICYPIDGSYGFTTATGGNCCYTCGDMCVHRFTSDGTFTIVS